MQTCESPTLLHLQIYSLEIQKKSVVLDRFTSMKKGFQGGETCFHC